jgi:peptidoglycan biosynthesis protein MviN/MurJ (putative lipid II flippase)
MLLSVAFFVALGLTGLGVVVTVRAGRRGDRRSHLRRALATLAMMTVAIVLALMLGEVRDFPDPAMGIHKIVARTSGALVLAVVLTGIMLWHRPKWRILHRGLVYTMVVVLGVAIGTGIWAFLLSTPKG